MRLEPLCNITLEYDADGLTLVRPFSGHEAQGFGIGTGQAVGDRLAGPIRWANYPRMSSDGVLMPDLRALIATEHGPVLFRLHGYSVPPRPEATTRTVTASIVFRTESEPHMWLNRAIAVHDGTIDFTTMTTKFPTYVCVPTTHA